MEIQSYLELIFLRHPNSSIDVRVINARSGEISAQRTKRKSSSLLDARI